jgi:hypothetical protein
MQLLFQTRLFFDGADLPVPLDVNFFDLSHVFRERGLTHPLHYIFLADQRIFHMVIIKNIFFKEHYFVAFDKTPEHFVPGDQPAKQTVH